MKVEIDFSPAQLGEIAAGVVAEMERQGKVMMEPRRTVPYTAEEAADVLCVSSKTIRQQNKKKKKERKKVTCM